LAANRKKTSKKGWSQKQYEKKNKRNGSKRKTKIEVVKVLRPIQELKQIGVRWHHNPEELYVKKRREGECN
jgi:hypothetical protein